MVKVMYNNQLVCKLVNWVFFGISLWTEKVVLRHWGYTPNDLEYLVIHEWIVFVIKLTSIKVTGNQFTSTTLRAKTSIKKLHFLELQHNKAKLVLEDVN